MSILHTSFSPEERDYIRSGALVPSHQEVIISAGIPDIEADVERIEQETSLLRARLDALTCQHEETKKLLFCRRALVAPIRRLSPEILGEVFIHCLPDGDFFTPCPDKFPPFVLGRVCSKWREVSIGTPRLWASLRVNLDGLPYIPDRIFELCLARSGQVPLHISLDNITPAVEDVILGFAHRFQRLRLSAESYYLLHKFQPFPMLKELLLPGQIEDTDIVMETQNLETIIAPVLQNVSVNISSHQYFDNLPWSQLTQLTLTGPWSCSAVFDILRNCSRLQKLTLFKCRSSSSEPVQQALVHAGLRSLEIVLNWDNRSYVVDFLENLVLPNLRRLIFRRFGACLFFKQAFLSLVSRSACPLMLLGIEITRLLKENEQLELVESLPSLRKMMLRCIYVHPNATPVVPSVAKLLAARNNPAST